MSGTNKKLAPIKYTNRDYESIQDDLLEHAKRYYPDSFKDFSEGHRSILSFRNPSMLMRIML